MPRRPPRKSRLARELVNTFGQESAWSGSADSLANHLASSTAATGSIVFSGDANQYLPIESGSITVRDGAGKSLTMWLASGSVPTASIVFNGDANEYLPIESGSITLTDGIGGTLALTLASGSVPTGSIVFNGDATEYLLFESSSITLTDGFGIDLVMYLVSGASDTTSLVNTGTGSGSSKPVNFAGSPAPARMAKLCAWEIQSSSLHVSAGWAAGYTTLEGTVVGASYDATASFEATSSTGVEIVPATNGFLGGNVSSLSNQIMYGNSIAPARMAKLCAALVNSASLHVSAGWAAGYTTLEGTVVGASYDLTASFEATSSTGVEIVPATNGFLGGNVSSLSSQLMYGDSTTGARMAKLASALINSASLNVSAGWAASYCTLASTLLGNHIHGNDNLTASFEATSSTGVEITTWAGGK